MTNSQRTSGDWKSDAGEPDATLRALLTRGATDEEIVAAAAPHADGDRTVERVVVDVLNRARHRWDDGEMHHRQTVHWYRRAVAAEHTWAMSEGGERWAFGGSSDTAPRGSASHEEEVTADEARRWLAAAADRGDRRACSVAARWHDGDDRVVGWLRIARGDGVPDVDHGFGHERLGADALMLARLLDRAGDPEAGAWYRAAAASPPWRFAASAPASWSEAVHGYAMWSHRVVGEELCEAWAFRLLADAADHGAGNRRYLDSEYKTYRNDWELARGEESARHAIMVHLLEEHDLPDWQRLEIALLLSNSRWFHDVDAAVVLDVLGRQPAVAPVTVARAWATVHWLLSGAVPLVFAFAGMADAGVRFAATVPDRIDARRDRDWIEAAQRFAGWEELHRRSADGDDWFDLEREGRVKRFVIDAVEGIGLGERRSPFATSGERYREDDVDHDFADTSWRLLRGSPDWLAMYGATVVAGASEEWMRWWDAAGGILVHALRGAALSLGRELGIDWSRNVGWDHPMPARWRELTESLARERAAFDAAAAAL